MVFFVVVDVVVVEVVDVGLLSHDQATVGFRLGRGGRLKLNAKSTVTKSQKILDISYLVGSVGLGSVGDLTLTECW